MEEKAESTKPEQYPPPEVESYLAFSEAREKRQRFSWSDYEPEEKEIEDYVRNLEDVDGNELLDNYFSELEEHGEKRGSVSKLMYTERDENEDRWFIKVMLPKLREVRLSEYARQRLDAEEEGAIQRLRNHWKKG